MLNFKHREKKSRGFTLIELVIGLAFIGLLISISFSVFLFTSRVSKQVLVEDDFLLQGRFALEYIREEIDEAIEIVSLEDYLPENFFYTDTLGFFIIKKESGFNHICYKFEDEKLTRISFETVDKKPNIIPSIKGNNPILENVSEIKDSYYDKDEGLLCIVIKTRNKENGKEYSFMETIYLKDDIN